MLSRRANLLALFTIILPCFTATADAQTASERRLQVNRHVVGVIAARRNGTMTELAEDLQIALNRPDLRIVPILGRGSIGNVDDLLYLRGVDAALVQSDVLDFYAQNEIEPDIDKKIRYIASLGPQKAHILARRDIQTIDDLQNVRFNIGRKNSGSFMSSSLLLEELGISVETTSFGHKKALKMLEAGELDAMFRMGGAPIPGMSGVSASNGVHLIDIPLGRVRAQTYAPAVLTDEDYPELIVNGRQVQTVQVETVLATYNWPRGHPRHENVASLNGALLANEAELRNGNYHPSWQHLNVNAELAGWKRFE